MVGNLAGEDTEAMVDFHRVGIHLVPGRLVPEDQYSTLFNNKKTSKTKNRRKLASLVCVS